MNHIYHSCKITVVDIALSPAKHVRRTCIEAIAKQTFFKCLFAMDVGADVTMTLHMATTSLKSHSSFYCDGHGCIATGSYRSLFMATIASSQTEQPVVAIVCRIRK